MIVKNTMPQIIKVTWSALLIVVLAGCAVRPPEKEANDPLEPMNRVIYKFNDVLDRAVLKPVSQGYQDYIPSPVRTGVRNFFFNIYSRIVHIKIN